MELFIIDLSVESISITKFSYTSSQRNEREIEREERGRSGGGTVEERRRAGGGGRE